MGLIFRPIYNNTSIILDILENNFLKVNKNIVLYITFLILSLIIDEFIFRGFIIKIINWKGKNVQEKDAKSIGIFIRILAFLISNFLFALSNFRFNFSPLSQRN